MNTLGDGLFHTATWLAVLIGLGILYNRIADERGKRIWRSRVLWSWMLAGWGFFNLVEGLIDHQLLGIHHVRSGAHTLAWDLAFLASGVLFLLVGSALARRGSFAQPVETIHSR